MKGINNSNMKNQDQSISIKWEKVYTLVLIANALYIVVFYILMQIYS